MAIVDSLGMHAVMKELVGAVVDFGTVVATYSRSLLSSEVEYCYVGAVFDSKMVIGRVVSSRTTLQGVIILAPELIGATDAES